MRFKKQIIASRERLLTQVVNWTKPHYVHWFKGNRQAWQQNKSTLLNYPKDSLGFELGVFLEKGNLELMPYLEDHDVFHVLLHYQTTIVDEVRMQFFLLGNHKRSCYALFTAFVGLLLVPEHHSTFFKEFQYGRQCPTVSKWDFSYLLNEPIQVLRQQIDPNKNAEEAPFYI